MYALRHYLLTMRDIFDAERLWFGFMWLMVWISGPLVNVARFGGRAH
jgi:hypothetical protein